LVAAVAVICVERRPLLRVGTLGTVVALLVMGGTTTGLAALALVLILYPVLVRYERARTALGRAFAPLMLGALAILAFAYATLNRLLVDASGKDLTFSKRSFIWEAVLGAVWSRPLTGYGWSVWRALWQPPASDVIAAVGFRLAESHNAAVEVLFRLGLIGLALYVTLLVAVVRGGLRLAAVGDRAGVFSVLLVAMIVVWGFSESLPLYGVWTGLLGVFAVPRLCLPGAVQPGRDVRLFAPRGSHVR
jgi:O-antigen ligase